MHRSLKRPPSPSFYPNNLDQSQRWTSPPPLSILEEESDTSRRVKFRTDSGESRLYDYEDRADLKYENQLDHNYGLGYEETPYDQGPRNGQNYYIPHKQVYTDASEDTAEHRYRYAAHDHGIESDNDVSNNPIEEHPILYSEDEQYDHGHRPRPESYDLDNDNEETDYQYFSANPPHIGNTINPHSYPTYDYNSIPYPQSELHASQAHPQSIQAVNSYDQNNPSTAYATSQAQQPLKLPNRNAERISVQTQLSENEKQRYFPHEGAVAENLDTFPNGSQVNVDDEDAEETGPVVKRRRVLALFAPSREVLAAAWYDPEKRNMEILEDTKDTRGWDLAILILEQVQPDVVLMSSNNDTQMVERVQAWATEDSTRLLIIPGKQCNYNSAIVHLSAVRLPDRSLIVSAPQPIPSASSITENMETSMPHRMEDTTGLGQHRLNSVKLGCWVNVQAPLAVIAAGQVVSELRYGLDGGLGGKSEFMNGFLELNSLESMDIERYMQINQDALTSLAIFSVEDHAAMFARDEKPALSIHGLLNTCITPLGKKLMHTWHLRPLVDLLEIQARHEAVGLFSTRLNSGSVDVLCRTMKRIKNLPYLFWKLRYGTAKFHDWRAIRDSLNAILEVRNTVIGMGWVVPVDIIEKMRTKVSAELETISSFMDEVIDWNSSKGQSRMSVAPGTNAELDDLRTLYSGEFSQFSHVIKEEIPRDIASNFSVIYLPHIGFHSVIVTEEDIPSPKIRGWTARFKTTDKHYYKNSSMVDLDNHYGDIYVMMTNLEVDIIQDLNTELQKFEPIIDAAVDIIAELDCLLSFARAVSLYKLVRPTMTNNTTLQIREGRHLLQEQVTDWCIPNDTLLAGGKDTKHHNMMIVTGANGSGKSIYGKQVALIVFMAQIGCFVPADSATIGLCDKIYTRLQTKESSSKHASAFMIDLGQVSQALRGATEKSLLIMDEFGKGTISWDGAGLLAGTIDYLQNGPCPRTVVLTHFHELITQEFIRENDGIVLAHMNVELVPESRELHFFWKLALGPTKHSYAADCALQHGIPQEVVDRAKYVTECVSKFDLTKLYDNKLTPAREAELRANEELAKRFLSCAFDEDTQVVRDLVEDMLEDTEIDKFKFQLIDSTDNINTNERQRQDNADEEIDELDSDDSNSVAYSDETD
uniref:DNA mismatch repair proteins mutS family domain-containing protein n=1 Tax=Kwoniella pini CBS 10737 TaxID=1296096 RepID=A0A1B9IBF1_9TREE|nr:uncharacterized protein I206_00016 [Kwoniella pini CBS 10737]OCF52720.1 hypothetical protein I206_00016 [Kwoniella pini CBS 10737]